MTTTLISQLMSPQFFSDKCEIPLYCSRFHYSPVKMRDILYNFLGRHDDSIVYARYDWCIENLSDTDYELTVKESEILTIKFNSLFLTIVGKDAVTSFRLLGP